MERIDGTLQAAAAAAPAAVRQASSRTSRYGLRCIEILLSLTFVLLFFPTSTFSTTLRSFFSWGTSTTAAAAAAAASKRLQRTSLKVKGRLEDSGWLAVAAAAAAAAAATAATAAFACPAAATVAARRLLRPRLLLRPLPLLLMPKVTADIVPAGPACPLGPWHRGTSSRYWTADPGQGPPKAPRHRSGL